jgi:hypothetical protein
MLSALLEPSAQFVEQPAQIDDQRSAGLLALTRRGAGGRIVGAARYLADSADTDCEFAVSVADT